MTAVRVVLEARLLKAADGAARKLRLSRSALVRDALRGHLARLATLEREARDREGYRWRPQATDDLAVWEKAAAWPED